MTVPDESILGCYNFAAFDMATKFAWVNGQPGMAAAQQTSDGLTNLAVNLDTARQATDRGIGDLGVAWRGQAADAARQSLTATAEGVGDTATVAQNGADRMVDHGRSFEAMRRQIDYMNPDDYNSFQRAVDHGSEAWHALWGAGNDHVTIAEHNQANDEVANRALARYQGETYETDGRFTTATAPAGHASGPTANHSVAPTGGVGGGGGPGFGTGSGGAGGVGAGNVPAVPVPAGPAVPVPLPGSAPAPTGPGSVAPMSPPHLSGVPGAPGARRPPVSARIPGTPEVVPRHDRHDRTTPSSGRVPPGVLGPGGHTGGGHLGPDRTPSPRIDPARPGLYPAVTRPDAGRVRDDLATRFGERARRQQLVHPSPYGGRGGFPGGYGGGDPHGTGGRGAGGGSTGGGGWGTEPRAPGSRSGLADVPSARTGEATAVRGGHIPGGYGPMMGGAGGVRDGRDHRNRYVVPTGEVFDVEITATDAVLGPEEDQR